MESNGIVTAHFHTAVYVATSGHAFVPEPWPSDVLETCLINAQVFIGPDPDPSTPADSFDVVVYSPASYALLGYRPELEIGVGIVLGAGHCFMQEWDQDAFEDEVRKLCAEASPGLEWATVALRIGMKLPWEFEHRYDIRAVPGVARSNVTPGLRPLTAHEPPARPQGAVWWSDDEYQGYREELLSQLSEGCLGIFQARWTVDERHHDRAVSERQALAEAVVIDLLNQGARLYTGPEVGRSDDRTAVPEHNVGQVLRDFHTWLPVGGELVWLDRG